MDKRLKQILGLNKSKESVNTDLYLKIDVNGDRRLLPPDNINKVLDLTEQFNLERQSCTFYRILGKLNPLVSNVLFNTTGTKDCWEILNTPLFTTNSYDEDNANMTFAESIKKNLKEIDGWYGYFNPTLANNRLCSFFDMEPKRERFSFIPDITNPLPNSSPIKNWELTITYPYTSDTTNILIDGGLLIIDKKSVLVGGKLMTALGLVVSHNLIIGDTIMLTGTNLDGQYNVITTGLENGDLIDYYFCLDIEPNDLEIHTNSRMVKLYNGVVSQYYFRKFKKIKTRTSDVIETDDYETFNLGFSENIFADNVQEFVFNEDIDVSDLVDNLGRPLSELYLTIVKTDSNGIFSNVSSGIEAPMISNLNDYNTNPYFLDLPIIQKIHNASGAGIPTSYTPLDTNVRINDIDFFGDIVEYNIATLNEVVLSDVNYRFNTVNREIGGNTIVSGPRPEGYYYKPHNLIRIRDFSSYIEEGDANTAGMPSYTVDLGDGRFIWRDIMDIGVIDINKEELNYPFVNNSHYMYQNYFFDVRRQDPFDNWDIYHAGFPSDPIGNIMNKKFVIKSSNNVC